jgi:hypothetical protein
VHHWQAELQLIRFPYLSDMESGKAAKLHLQQTVQQTLTFAVFLPFNAPNTNTACGRFIKFARKATYV